MGNSGANTPYVLMGKWSTENLSAPVRSHKDHGGKSALKIRSLTCKFSAQISGPHFSSSLSFPWIPQKPFLLPQPQHQCNRNPQLAASCSTLTIQHQHCVLQHHWWEKHTYVDFGSVWQPYYCFKNSSREAFPSHADVGCPSSKGTSCPRNRLRPGGASWSPDSIKAQIWVSGNLSEGGLSKKPRVKVKQAMGILRN